MKFEIFPREDRGLYLKVAVILLFIGLVSFGYLAPDKAFGMSGLMTSLAGAYWIAAGVALGKTDLANLERASISGGVKYIGVDPNKKAITNLFLVQSRKAKFGIALVALGTLLQAASVCLGS